MDLLVTLINLVTCLAIFVAIWQLLFHARQMHRDLEMHYVDQYWKIMHSTSTEWRLTYFLGEPNSSQDLRAVQDYLQLCEDEVELRANARVTDSTWFLWASAIFDLVSTPVFASALASSPTGLFRGLKKMMASSEPSKYDPCPHSQIWRRIHGL